MHRHGPSCLEGPISFKRRRWQQSSNPGLDSTNSPREAGTMSSNEHQNQTKESPIRWELVERVRREIEAGTYETSEKMDLALERLLDQLEGN